MKTNIFNLQIIPIEKIKPQEIYDEKNSISLLSIIKKENKIRNPIIVAPLTKDSFIQLDGMNRLSVFKMLKIPAILCHVVDYQDIDQVELASWVHFNKLEEKDFLKKIKEIKGIDIKAGNISDVKNRYVQSVGRDRICMAVTRKNRVFQINYAGNLLEKVNALNKIVSLYSNDIVRDALPQNNRMEDIKVIFKEHPRCNLLMVFPTFTRHQIMKVVRKGGLLPSGISRHIIKRRCLDVDIPLDLFKSEKSIEEKNEELEKILLDRRFRLYEEPTIYFE